MGSDGIMPRTWSGPGGSSHKWPLMSVRVYSAHFRMSGGMSVRRVCRATAEGPEGRRMDVLIALLQDPRSFIADWITNLGAIWVYAPLFAIIFIETGLVIMPFLPGDSLLFTAGIFAADGGGLNLAALLILMYLAAILGNTSNYWIGRALGKAIVDSGRVKALTPERMEKTQQFFDKYGLLAIVVTRFFPIIRTIAPFVAGLGRMSFPRFTVFNIAGGVLWVSIFVLLGYFFGGVLFVQENFELVIIAIVVISFIPAVGGAIKMRLSARREKKAAAASPAPEQEPAEQAGESAAATSPALEDEPAEQAEGSAAE